MQQSIYNKQIGSPEERAFSTSSLGRGVPSPRNPSIPFELFLKDIIQSELPRTRLGPRFSLTEAKEVGIFLLLLRPQSIRVTFNIKKARCDAPLVDVLHVL